MCGIVGISAETNVAAEIYDSLLMLQHRGQDAAGMVVCDTEDQLNSRKSMGYVRDVFEQKHILLHFLSTIPIVSLEVLLPNLTSYSWDRYI